MKRRPAPSSTANVASRRRLTFGLMAAIAGLSCLNAPAVVQIDLGLDTEFSGGVAPVNTNTPWICAQFSTVGSDVLFTLIATANLTDPESARQFYFNFDDSLDVSLLNFDNVVGSTGSFSLPVVNRLTDGYKADGDGLYDIRLDFATGTDVDTTFSAGDSISYLLSYVAPITEEAFAHLSTDAGGHGPFYAASHVQNTSVSGGEPTESGWIAATEVTPIPEPAALLPVGLGLTALGFFKRKTI